MFEQVFHHRLKTHAGWRYTTLEVGSYLWSDPDGKQFLCDPRGTRDVAPPDRPVALGNGCRARPTWLDRSSRPELWS